MPDGVTPVRLYFDPVSPYSYLGLWQAEAFARRHSVRWDVRPVVYAALLDHHGLVGPVETTAKRRYTFLDVLRCASLLGAPLVGPPAHPFRSLEALRAVCLFAEDPRSTKLAAALSSAAWAEGRAITDVEVVADVVRSCGLDATDLARRIAAPEVKSSLREMTTEAIEAGVFGVPTFRLGDELFWGHDRLPHLAARLEGDLPATEDATRELRGRPRGADRPGRPRHETPGDDPGQG